MNSYIIQPPVFGNRHSRPLPYDIGLLPTRGQTLLIFYFIVLNVVLCSVGYKSYEPNAWYVDRQAELTAYIANRMGTLSFANLPLLILYSSRNNILLYITDWSRETFVMIHRWIAYICILEAVLHSAIYLRVYIIEGTYSIEIEQPYWIWGVVATLALSLLAPLSLYVMRKRFFEVFLSFHVLLVLLALIGCYLHVWYNYYHQWGYEVWIYAAFAVYAFDRIVRLAKIALNKFRRATITILDDDYFRIDIPHVSTGGGHAYLSFPTLEKWHFWESHPFSVLSTVPPQFNQTAETASQQQSDTKPVVRTDSTSDNSSDQRLANLLSEACPHLGLTFFVRRSEGITSILYAHAKAKLPCQLFVLVDSPYGPAPEFGDCPTLICIAGGVGITGIVPTLARHSCQGGRTVLYWSVRSTALASQVQHGYLSRAGPKLEKYVAIGERFNVAELVNREIDRVGSEENIAFMVCGPAGMSDEARLAVCKFQRGRRGLVKFVEAKFSC